TSPTVSSVSPADGATNVAVAVRPTVSFSEAMSAASVTSGAVRLLGPGGLAIAQAAGSPSLDASGTVATIIPAASLAGSTIYQIQVLGGTSGVKDAAGNALANTFQ